jgi:hypothetical protein
MESKERPLVECPEGELVPYVGVYSRPTAELHLRILDSKLVLQMLPKRNPTDDDGPPPPTLPLMSVALSDPDNLVITDGPRKTEPLEVIRNADGSIGWVRFGLRIYKRQT